MISTWKPAWVCHWGLLTLLSPSWIPEDSWWENPTCILQGCYLEVYASTIVCVIFGEYLVDKLFCFCIWENINVHPQQLVPPHLTVGIILDESTSKENWKHCKILELCIYLNHSWISFSSRAVFFFKYSRSSFESCNALLLFFLNFPPEPRFLSNKDMTTQTFSSHKSNRTDS